MEKIQAAPNGNQVGSKDGSEIIPPLPPTITIKWGAVIEDLFVHRNNWV